MRLFGTKPGSGTHDKGADVAAWCFVITFLVLAGAWTYYPLVWREKHTVPIPQNLLVTSCIVSVISGIAFVSAPVLRRIKVNWPRRIAACIWVFILGPLLLSGLILLLNGALDTSQPIAHDVQVLSWRRTSGRAGSSRLSPWVKDWRGQGEILLSPRGDTGENIDVNAPILRVITKKGFFGYEWYSSLRSTEIVASGQASN